MSLRWLSYFRCSGLLVAAGCFLTAVFVGTYVVDLPNRRVTAGPGAALVLVLLFGAVAALVAGRKSSRRSRTTYAVAQTIIGLAAAMLTTLWAINPLGPVVRPAGIQCRILWLLPHARSPRATNCTCLAVSQDRAPGVVASDCHLANRRHPARER